MSEPPVTPSSGSSDAPDEPRPRPSWGHPGPAETPPDAAPEQPPYGRPGPPSYGQPGQTSYGQPGQGRDQGGQPSWPGQQEYGQPQYGQPLYGQPRSGQPQYGQPSPSQYGQDLGRHEQAYAQMYGEKPRHGMAIASLVLGILAFLAAWFPFVSYAGVVMSALAIIFGVIGVRRTSGRGMAIAGLVLGGISLVASVLLSIWYTNFFIDVARVDQECAELDPSRGAGYERCLTERSEDLIPFQ